MTTTELKLVPASAAPLSTASNMKALVYHGPAQRAVSAATTPNALPITASAMKMTAVMTIHSTSGRLDRSR